MQAKAESRKKVEAERAFARAREEAEVTARKALSAANRSRVQDELIKEVLHGASPGSSTSTCQSGCFV